MHTKDHYKQTHLSSKAYSKWDRLQGGTVTGLVKQSPKYQIGV